MIKKIYFWIQFLLGLLFLGIGILLSFGWIWELIIEPDGKMLLDWQLTLPVAFLSTLIFLELGLYLFYKILANNFFNKIIKNCNYLLMSGSGMLIIFFLIVVIKDGFPSDFFVFLIAFIMIAVPTLIFTITYKLNRSLQIESNN